MVLVSTFGLAPRSIIVRLNHLEESDMPLVHLEGVQTREIFPGHKALNLT